jgi:hypothetical protein
MYYVKLIGFRLLEAAKIILIEKRSSQDVLQGLI